MSSTLPDLSSEHKDSALQPIHPPLADQHPYHLHVGGSDNLDASTLSLTLGQPGRPASGPPDRLGAHQLEPRPCEGTTPAYGLLVPPSASRPAGPGSSIGPEQEGHQSARPQDGLVPPLVRTHLELASRPVGSAAASYPLPTFGTTSLVFQLGYRVVVELTDGRHLFGWLVSFDRFANVVLYGTVERIFVGNRYGDISLGHHIVRADSLVWLGEAPNPEQQYSLSGIHRVSPYAILRAVREANPILELSEDDEFGVAA